MKLPLSSKIDLITKVANDYADFVDVEWVPKKLSYKIAVSSDNSHNSDARQAAFESLVQTPIQKFAFDTRRVDQENTRNPRKNLQYWHRTDQFIDEEDDKKLNTFAKLARVLGNMKKRLGKEPEWFESYSRQLYDNVYRILRVKESDMDIFRPQMAYLEQLIFARYRLTMENLEKYSEDVIEESILKKDEELIGRSNYLKATGHEDEKTDNTGIVKDSLEKTTQDSIVNAIFGGDNIRREGEKKVERTITIKITENVVD